MATHTKTTFDINKRDKGRGDRSVARVPTGITTVLLQAPVKWPRKWLGTKKERERKGRWGGGREREKRQAAHLKFIFLYELINKKHERGKEGMGMKNDGWWNNIGFEYNGEGGKHLPS